jgi:hypothetical protein
MLALSISRSVQHLTGAPVPVNFRVLAVFDRACDLVTPGGQVVALVTPDIGDGPFNVVVEAHAGEWSSIEPGTPAQIQASVLRLGEMQITLTQAIAWEPCPDWNALRLQRAVIAGHLPQLQATVQATSAKGLLISLEETTGTETDLEKALYAGWHGDLAQLQHAAKGLAGLGQGLTPAGDDFLCGLMLWTWVAHPAPREFCRDIAEAAAPRTTTLSAAFLRAASRGECSVAWHKLLYALAGDADEGLEQAARNVLACGETSGADTLAGFIYAAYLAGDLSNERLQPGAQK